MPNSEKVNSAKFREVCPFCKVGAVKKNTEYLCGTTIHPLHPKQSYACKNRVSQLQLADEQKASEILAEQVRDVTAERDAAVADNAEILTVLRRLHELSIKLQDHLTPDELKAAEKKWHDKFDDHPGSALLREMKGYEQILDGIRETLKPFETNEHTVNELVIAVRDRLVAAELERDRAQKAFRSCDKDRTAVMANCDEGESENDKLIEELEAAREDRNRFYVWICCNGDHTADCAKYDEESGPCNCEFGIIVSQSNVGPISMPETAGGEE